MRLVNDREERAENPSAGALQLVLQTLLTSLGVSSGLFGPLPMILGTLRLEEPWPKVTALAGCLLAIFLLSVSPSAALISFVMGVFISDRIKQGTLFWNLLGQVFLVSILAGVVGLLIEVPPHHQSFLHYWGATIDLLIGSLKTALPLDATFPWVQVREMLYHQGPFIFSSFCILSFWFSAGLASHLGWLDSTEQFSPNSLRNIRVSGLLSAAFLLTFGVRAAIDVRSFPALGGLLILLATFCLIQGCVLLSNLMKARNLGRSLRGAIYCVSIFFGPYLLIVLGLISPFFFRKNSVTEVRT